MLVFNFNVTAKEVAPGGNSRQAGQAPAAAGAGDEGTGNEMEIANDRFSTAACRQHGDEGTASC